VNPVIKVTNIIALLMLVVPTYDRLIADPKIRFRASEFRLSST
jgi:hypothetical protein